MTSIATEPIVRDWLVGVLKDGPVSVTFTKVDGTERVMKCTLKEELIPAQPIQENITTKVERKVNEEVVRVYDLEKESWRSFRLDSIMGVSFTI